MKLIIKQKIVSWFDSYNVYDENNNVVYVIKGKLAWGHKFVIFDANEQELGSIKEEIFSLLPTYKIYKDNEEIGQIKQKFSFFKPEYVCDLGDYKIEGNFLGLEYKINKNGKEVAKISKKLIAWSDTYTIDANDEDAFNALLIVVAIDANLSRNKNNH